MRPEGADAGDRRKRGSSRTTHAVVELAIRDLKDQALAHFPSGKPLANAAWTVIAELAHNLLRWTTLIGLPGTVILTARTVRRGLLTVPGRITRTARTVTLRMPARWPWELAFLAALLRLRALPTLHRPHRIGKPSSDGSTSVCIGRRRQRPTDFRNCPSQRPKTTRR